MNRTATQYFGVIPYIRIHIHIHKQLLKSI